MTPKDINEQLIRFGDYMNDLSDAGTPELMAGFHHYMADKPFVPGADLIERFHHFRLGWIACSVYMAGIAKAERGRR